MWLDVSQPRNDSVVNSLIEIEVNTVHWEKTNPTCFVYKKIMVTLVCEVKNWKIPPI